MGFVLIAFILCASGQTKEELAEQVTSALGRLDSLSLVVEYTKEGHELTKPANDHQQINVLMGKHSCARVESTRDGRPAWRVINDGTNIVEWSADGNRWTKYAVVAGEQPNYKVRQLLLSRKIESSLPTKFGESWLDPDCSEWRDLRSVFLDPAARVKHSASGDGAKLTFVDTISSMGHPDGALYGSANSRIKLYIENSTQLPVRMVEFFKAGPPGVSLFAFNTEFRYSGVVKNPRLDATAFVFDPPIGSTFVPPKELESVPLPKSEGKPAPDFALKSIDSEEIKLGDYRGKKPVLVVFWATWCGPCQLEIPFLRALRREYGNDQLAILAVTHEDITQESLNSFAKRKKVNYLLLHDAKEDVSKSYSVKSIPKSVLIDKSGTVVKVWEGWAGDEEAKEIRAEIAKLIGPPRKAATTEPAEAKAAP